MKAIINALIFIMVISFCSCGQAVKIDTPSFDALMIKTGKEPGSVEVADFNKDGFPDIVVENAGDSDIMIFLGNGKKDFSQAKGSPFFANRFPNDIAIADFNNDGNKDIGIANTEVSFLTILLGNGKGQFEQARLSPFTVNARPHTHGIAAADFNGDGNIDLVTDSWGNNQVIVLQGDGKGNFSRQNLFNVGKRPYQRLRAADVNNDGKPDIVTTNLEGNNTTVLLGTGNMNFTEAPGSPYPSGDAPFAVAIGDVNGDNNTDLAIANAPTITSESRGKDGLTILNGDGKGKFTTVKGSPFQTGKSPGRIAIGDIDGNGISDIAVTNYNDKSISIFYMGKNGPVSIKQVKAGNLPHGIAIHDMNGDGKNDILVSNNDDNSIIIYFRK